MREKRNINWVSAAIWVLLIVMLAYFTLIVLHDTFGLLGGKTEKISEYNVEFITKKDNGIKFEVNKRLYLHDSREFFCEIKDIVIHDEYITIRAKIKGYYQNETFYLNGNHYIAKNSTIFIMNNRTEIKIMNIF